MQLLSMILRFLLRVVRSFQNLLSVVFIGLPLAVLMLIFPPLRRKFQSILSLRSIIQTSVQRIKGTAVYPQEYLAFLQEILLTTAESNSNPEVVYPLLQNNLDKLDETFAEGLSQWTTATLPTLESEQAYEIARVIFNFSTLIGQFSLGNRGSNLEIAIKACQAIVSVFTRDAFPYEWAGTQNNLGNAYLDRIRGEKADNLEAAIACYRESLKVYTPDAFPTDWAMTQTNLGLAYSDRIRGEKADNLEAAIACYRESLKVHTPEAFPYQWAGTQTNLGNAYSNRIRGEKADNLEAAIACYQESLKVYTSEAFPYQWATTQNNLGNAYLDRIRGEKADNLEAAIACYQESLKVYIPQAFPYEWARTQNNLGNAYLERIRGEKADNLEVAIACYRESLKVYTPEAFPSDWAMTQNNLGIAYRKRIRREKADNLEAAIARYQESLKVYTSETFPYQWATTQNNLGNAYLDRIRGEKADNLEAAIACYRESLKVRTPEALPLECLRTGRNLGNLAFGEGNWQLAIEAYNRAIEAVEISWSWAMTPQSKQEVMEAAIDVYHNIVQACLNTKQNYLALEYVERSKTRNLVELLATRALKPRGDFSPAIVEELDRLRDKLRTEQIYLANQERKYNTLLESGQPSQPSRPDRTRLKQLQQELDEFIERNISPIDPTFSLTQKVETIPFSDIQSLIDERTAIVEWYITGEKILAFIVSLDPPQPPLDKGGQLETLQQERQLELSDRNLPSESPFLRETGGISVWQSSTEDWTNLVNWVNEYLRTYYTNRQQWRNELETRLPKLAEILHLDDILLHLPPGCDRLILIPHRFLHLLPLHALPVSSPTQVGRGAGGEDKYLLDLFPRGVQYAPSCQLLKLAQNQQRPDFYNLFAIQNPTGDLIYAELEVEAILSFFPSPSSQILPRQEATEEAVRTYQELSSVHCGHFACHGTFNPQSPLESALILANKERLTLGEIFELSLFQCRLVTLSACETGLTDFSNLSDEYIGLPSGFLFAGSPSVVSSLWTVSDLSTAFLMIKFYENLTPLSLTPLEKVGQGGAGWAEGKGVSVAIALQKAQQWLRDLNCQEFERELTKPQFQRAIAQLQQILSPADFFELEDAIEVERENLKKFNPNHKPFANPFYWAAFVATGV
ncbi:MAG: CHAT domain-containing protein [Xenococcaceae cyanobacterium]